MSTKCVNTEIITALKVPPVSLAEKTGVSWAPPRIDPPDFDDAHRRFDLSPLAQRVSMIQPSLPERAGPYQLRPCWIPALDLHFELSSVTTIENEPDVFQAALIKRKMLMCRTPEYVWQDEAAAFSRIRECWRQTMPASTVLFTYNHVERTLKSKPVAGFSADFLRRLAEVKHDQLSLRRAAVQQLPFLFPRGPVRVGDKWMAEIDPDLMTYELVDAQESLGVGMLVILRNGLCSIQPPLVGAGDASNRRLAMQVKGQTIVATGTGLILEDRLLCSFTGVRMDKAPCLLNTRIFTRLVGFGDDDSLVGDKAQFIKSARESGSSARTEATWNMTERR